MSRPDTQSSTAGKPSSVGHQEGGTDLLDLAMPLVRRWPALFLVPLLSGAAGLGISYLMTPVFTASSAFLPPQQQSVGTSALASLGALSSLAGAAGGMKSPIDQYVALMNSVQVADRLIVQFKLMEVYDADYRDEARRSLSDHVSITAGKKDGLIRVEVDDEDPERAAAIANQYVHELRRLTSTLAVTEAQQRRLFFERQLQETKTKLTSAQQALQAVGFNPGAVKAEPKAAAEAYGKLKAELTSAEVRLQTMRGTLAETATEVKQQVTIVQSLRGQLTRLEHSQENAPADADYISRYREFKYQETLFDLFARQYELARADESREGALIQVVDVAQPPERKNKPRRKWVALGFAIAGGLLFAGGILLRARLAAARRDPVSAARLQEFTDALLHRR